MSIISINLLILIFLSALNNLSQCRPNTSPVYGNSFIANNDGDGDSFTFNENFVENVRLKRSPSLENPKNPKNSKNNDETESSYWTRRAQIKLLDQLIRLPNLNIAKNIILFLGDGMSVPTLAASRIYKGQLEGKRGEDTKLFIEDLPHVGLSKTYCVDRQVADSACSATAYLCGVKANFMTIGVNAKVALNDCTASENPSNHVSSIAHWAQRAKKSTGVITTTRITHASPSGNYAHIANRNFESDANVGNNSCQDIASQLIFNGPGNRLKVIMGGGRKKFIPQNVTDEDGNLGERLDGQNLIKHWLRQKKGAAAEYIWSRDQLRQLDYTRTDYLLGLFNSDHMEYHLDSDGAKEPTLSEMTAAAIRMLKKDDNGYFLFVEGGRIDHGHHEVKARKALDETVEFDKAIKLAREMTNESDTLIVVTSDHAHTMSISGYPVRGNDILGLNSVLSDVDGLPYTTISYANGPGFMPHINGTRQDLSEVDLNDKDYRYPGLVPLVDETHGGDDVGVFASGPWSHIFDGFYEQNVIPHMMAFASCVGSGVTACGYRDVFKRH